MRGPERPRALIAEPDGFSPAALERLRSVFEVETRHWPTDRLVDAFAAFDVVWIRLGYRVGAPDLRHSRCRVLAVATTGLDHIDVAACTAAGVQVVSLLGETSFLRDVRATAEHTVGLMLALLRHIPAAASSVLDGGWQRDAFRGREIFGATVGIVGMGRLGSIVAEYTSALGATVIGFDPARADFPPVAKPMPSLVELLRRSDIVSLHVPYSDRTRHLIGQAELASMRAGALLVNTSRGGVLDQDALVDALRSARLAAAALDVLDPEPPGADHPLIRYAREHPNLLITPHIGGNTLESVDKTERFIADRVLAAYDSPS